MKREPTVCEDIFANEPSDMWLISKIQKEFIQIHTRKTKWSKNGQRT